MRSRPCFYNSLICNAFPIPCCYRLTHAFIILNALAQRTGGVWDPRGWKGGGVNHPPPRSRWLADMIVCLPQQQQQQQQHQQQPRSNAHSQNPHSHCAGGRGGASRISRLSKFVLRRLQYSKPYLEIFIPYIFFHLIGICIFPLIYFHVVFGLMCLSLCCNALFSIFVWSSDFF